MPTKTAEPKRSLFETVATVCGMPVVVALVYFITLPFGLGVAWIQATIWNWFLPPYLHLPRVSMWLMFVIGLLVWSFRGSKRAFKDEYFKESEIENLIGWMAILVLQFGLAAFIHHFILKG